MSRARGASSPESESTNGRNGAGNYGQLLAENTRDIRKAITIQALFGSISDARLLYYALPGTTGESWEYLERVIDPVRKYVLDGDPPYVVPLRVAEYAGVPTPEGDCAEDALPRELRNPNREKLKLEGNGNAE